MTTIASLAQVGESYLLDAGAWSLVGFAGGYVVGRVHCWLRKKDHRDRT